MTPSVTRQCSSPRLHNLKCRTCRLFMLVTFAKSLTYISRLLSHNMFVIISHCATRCKVAHHSTLRGLRSVSIAAKQAGEAVTRLFLRTYPSLCTFPAFKFLGHLARFLLRTLTMTRQALSCFQSSAVFPRSSTFLHLHLPFYNLKHVTIDGQNGGTQERGVPQRYISPAAPFRPQDTVSLHSKSISAANGSFPEACRGFQRCC